MMRVSEGICQPVGRASVSVRFHLVENNRHDEEVQQEALGEVWTVEVEEDECEEQREELEAGVAERWTQEFQSSNRCQENVAAGDDTQI